jgi:murein L,D-transpeptidase YcbB/YkuD
MHRLQDTYISTLTLARHLVTALLCATLVAGPAAAQSAASELLRERLEYAALGGELVISDVRLHAAPLMLEVYAASNFELLWTRPEQLAALATIARRMDDEGLDSGDLPLNALRQAAAAAENSAADIMLVERDLLATETFVRAAYLLFFGKVNPYKLDNDWNFKRALRPDTDPADFIFMAITTDDLSKRLYAETPRGPFYLATMQALADFRQIEQAGGWQALSAGATLREDERDPRAQELRARLRITGQLSAADDTGTDLFDAGLAAAVQRFQDQHGLDIDGAVGPGTFAALNVPVGTRIDQLRMALERMRWIMDDRDDNMLVVNIAGFRAILVQNGAETWNGRVMVGKPFRKTPVFRDDIEYLVFNPTWTVPPGILAKDTLPAIQRDPGYLERTNMTVLTHDGTPVDPATIDWPSMQARGFPYILWQQPGPKNAMGQVKFIFPNEHFVFLHDTPSRNLFDRPERAFSSGCIRVENPLELAELLLDDKDKWSRADIDSILAQKKTRTIHLRDDFSVMLMYLTALTEPDGTTRFYRDIYERDARLLQALNADIVIDAPTDIFGTDL